MKIESFDDYITDMFFLSPMDKMDIKQAYHEFVQKEIDAGVEEQLTFLKKQIAAELEPKIRNEIQQEAILDCITELRSEQRLFRSLIEKLMSTPEGEDSVDIRKTSNIPIFDRLWNSIRKWQRDTGTSNAKLTVMLGISERTLRDYDKSARTMTLEKLSNFLNCTNGSIELKL